MIARLLVINSILSKSIVHVPKLTCNLMSITKLIKDLDCPLIFFSFRCVIQERMGKMIRQAMENGGLYYLETKNGDDNSANMVCSSALKEMDILLWHNRLGHPSFPIMQKIFPLISIKYYVIVKFVKWINIIMPYSDQ